MAIFNICLIHVASLDCNTTPMFFLNSIEFASLLAIQVSHLRQFCDDDAVIEFVLICSEMGVHMEV